MKKRVHVYAVLFVMMAALSFFNCWTDDEDTKTQTSSLTVTIDNGAQKSFTSPLGTYFTSTPANMSASVIPNNSTSCWDMESTNDNIFVTFVGTTTGTYTIESGNANVYYKVAGVECIGNTNASGGGYTVTGTIVVTEYGAVGQRIKGTYTVSNALYGSSRVTMTGSFDVERVADDSPL